MEFLGIFMMIKNLTVVFCYVSDILIG
ncbi:Protein CBG27868 [Caenorhabditis briggsae]|uniref:Protein CBG27868 n=1 Tax=Caenorhabditis briggsae TaxID=6238 RepID=B6IEG3_CAEBR|nr:Protein CBG27868 [Caenorhabditis briggsae]CAR98293.1 Protein CBG27868 [Caenorhabditis briggsae]